MVHAVQLRGISPPTALVTILAGIKVRDLPRPVGLRDTGAMLALLPQRAQWVSLGGLVQDGCSFTLSLLRGAWARVRGAAPQGALDDVLRVPAASAATAPVDVDQTMQIMSKPIAGSMTGNSDSDSVASDQ